MSIAVYYGGSKIIDEQASCVKKLDTQGKYLEDDVTIDYQASTPTLISKSITTNATYNASSDNADGYSSVTVNVPDTAGALIDQSISGTVIVPSGTSTLRAYIFRDCTNITNIDFQANITAIGNHAMNNCTSLQSLKIPGSVKTIGDYAIIKCTGLTQIDCTELTVTNGTINTTISSYEFTDTNNCPLIFATQAIMEVYAQATNWARFARRMTYVGA